MAAILTFFVAHWALCVFVQTFYLHRYGAHRQFTMSKGWERFFHLLTFIGQGSSYLDPRSYAIMHREHHAFSDTEKDPHSPHFFKDVFRMMWATKNRYHGLLRGTQTAEDRFTQDAPSWPLLDRIGDSWFARLAWGTAYTLFYVAFAPHWVFYLLIPIHYVMGPVHGAIVNWAGHKYGYRNFPTRDRSKNTLPIEFLVGGELFQNNHHRFPMAPNFAAAWWEVDPTYGIIWMLDKVGIIDLGRAQKARLLPVADAVPAPVPVPVALRPAALETRTAP